MDYIWIALVLTQAASIVDGSGVIEINFIEFENFEGRRLDGKCCDKNSWWSTDKTCSDECDHNFVLCMGNATDSSNMSACEFGEKKIETVGGNRITFNGNVGDYENPVKFTFKQWPGIAKLKIDVLDMDDEGFDFVDRYEYQYNIRDLSRETETSAKSLKLTGRGTRINMELKVFCDINHYGTDCGTYCEETDDHTGHYRCDPATGDKICMSGWTGDKCLQNFDDCEGNRCYNGSTCVDGVNSYTCLCPPGRTGHTCHLEINECASRPCKNGGICKVTSDGFRCECLPGYTGPTCLFESEECTCLNGGECTDGPASSTCSCPAGFEGDRCELDVDECKIFPNLCGNNGRCINQIGEFECRCHQGYTGKTCAIGIECKRSPCVNSGVCKDTIDGYLCKCPIGYTGVHCEINPTTAVSTTPKLTTTTSSYFTIDDSETSAHPVSISSHEELIDEHREKSTISVSTSSSSTPHLTTISSSTSTTEYSETSALPLYILSQRDFTDEHLEEATSTVTATSYTTPQLTTSTSSYFTIDDSETSSVPSSIPLHRVLTEEHREKSTTTVTTATTPQLTTSTSLYFTVDDSEPSTHPVSVSLHEGFKDEHHEKSTTSVSTTSHITPHLTTTTSSYFTIKKADTSKHTVSILLHREFTNEPIYESTSKHETTGEYEVQFPDLISTEESVKLEDLFDKKSKSDNITDFKSIASRTATDVSDSTISTSTLSHTGNTVSASLTTDHFRKVSSVFQRFLENTDTTPLIPITTDKQKHAVDSSQTTSYTETFPTENIETRSIPQTSFTDQIELTSDSLPEIDTIVEDGEVHVTGEQFTDMPSVVDSSTNILSTTSLLQTKRDSDSQFVSKHPNHSIETAYSLDTTMATSTDIVMFPEKQITYNCCAKVFPIIPPPPPFPTFILYSSKGKHFFINDARLLNISLSDIHLTTESFYFLSNVMSSSDSSTKLVNPVFNNITVTNRTISSPTETTIELTTSVPEKTPIPPANRGKITRTDKPTILTTDKTDSHHDLKTSSGFKSDTDGERLIVKTTTKSSDISNMTEYIHGTKEPSKSATSKDQIDLRTNATVFPRQEHSIFLTDTYDVSNMKTSKSIQMSSRSVGGSVTPGVLSFRPMVTLDDKLIFSEKDMTSKCCENIFPIIPPPPPLPTFIISSNVGKYVPVGELPSVFSSLPNVYFSTENITLSSTNSSIFSTERIDSGFDITSFSDQSGSLPLLETTSKTTHEAPLVVPTTYDQVNISRTDMPTFSTTEKSFLSTITFYNLNRSADITSHTDGMITNQNTAPQEKYSSSSSMEKTQTKGHSFDDFTDFTNIPDVNLTTENVTLTSSVTNPSISSTARFDSAKPPTTDLFLSSTQDKTRITVEEFLNMSSSEENKIPDSHVKITLPSKNLLNISSYNTMYTTLPPDENVQNYLPPNFATEKTVYDGKMSDKEPGKGTQSVTVRETTKSFSSRTNVDKFMTTVKQTSNYYMATPKTTLKRVIDPNRQTPTGPPEGISSLTTTFTVISSQDDSVKETSSPLLPVTETRAHLSEYVGTTNIIEHTSEVTDNDRVSDDLKVVTSQSTPFDKVAFSSHSLATALTAVSLPSNSITRDYRTSKAVPKYTEMIKTSPHSSSQDTADFTFSQSVDLTTMSPFETMSSNVHLFQEDTTSQHSTRDNLMKVFPFTGSDITDSWKSKSTKSSDTIDRSYVTDSSAVTVQSQSATSNLMTDNKQLSTDNMSLTMSHTDPNFAKEKTKQMLIKQTESPFLPITNATTIKRTESDPVAHIEPTFEVYNSTDSTTYEYISDSRLTTGSALLEHTADQYSNEPHSQSSAHSVPATGLELTEEIISITRAAVNESVTKPTAVIEMTPYTGTPSKHLQTETLATFQGSSTPSKGFPSSISSKSLATSSTDDESHVHLTLASGKMVERKQSATDSPVVNSTDAKKETHSLGISGSKTSHEMHTTSLMSSADPLHMLTSVQALPTLDTSTNDSIKVPSYKSTTTLEMTGSNENKLTSTGTSGASFTNHTHSTAQIPLPVTYRTIDKSLGTPALPKREFQTTTQSSQAATKGIETLPKGETRTPNISLGEILIKMSRGTQQGSMVSTTRSGVHSASTTEDYITQHSLIVSTYPTVTYKRSFIRHKVDLTSNDTYPHPRKEIYEYDRNTTLAKGKARLTIKRIRVTVIRTVSSAIEAGKKVVLQTYQRVKNITTRIRVATYSKSRQLLQLALGRVEALFKYSKDSINHFIVKPLLNAKEYVRERLYNAYVRLGEEFRRGKLIFKNTAEDVREETQTYFQTLANYYTGVYRQYSTEVRNIFESLKIPDA